MIHDDTTPQQQSLPLRVVGIGASAGGLNAIETFFDNVPKETGMAFVVVQHLSPDFKSFMDELLARHTDLPIHLVEDGMLVEPNHVYLIPSGKQMVISGGRLRLSDRDAGSELSLPIDVFFRSLARDCGARAVAIVLSGGGSDGSRGILDVADAGGLVIVQDVDSAQFDGMPRTAVESGVARWVLTPQDMPRVLLEHVAGGAPGTEASGGVRGLAAVYRMLQDEFGIDFTHYKPNTITRRIERRLALSRSQDIEEYVERLKRERDELDHLYGDLLIGVTSFFRDREAFDRLEQQVLPELLQRLPRERPLRVWVAGCATGEEVYSLSILIHEVMQRLGVEHPVKIFATDVHRASLNRAVQGIYDESALANVSEERLARYFARCGNSYQVVADLRQPVVFAQHDVIKDAPFTHLDLIACRNLLIYLRPETQNKALANFHFGLNPEGVLFLGSSETVGPQAHGFDTIDRAWRLYSKRADVRLLPSRNRVLQVPEARTVAPLLAPSGRYSLTHLLGTYDALLEKVMPPSVLVTQRGEVVHSFGKSSRFLRLRDGRQGLDLLDLVSPELRMVLTGGLKRVASESGAIVYKGVPVSWEGEDRRFEVALERIDGGRGSEPHVLVSFRPHHVRGDHHAARDDSKVIDLDEVPRQHLGALEAELAFTKENLQSTIEQLEASNEELQSSNEELRTSNEELQSTNEELQSVNEELYTVNAEYQRKIGELTELTNDMDNLLASTDVGTMFLDGELRIRKFTPQIADAFSLVPHDVGRPIETFASRLQHPELMDDLRRVLAGAGLVERDMGQIGGRSCFLRILPYRAKGATRGVVLTLLDVSSLKAAEDALFHERYLLKSLMVGIPDAIYFKDAGGRFIRANEAVAARFGLKDPAEAVGKSAFDLPNRQLAMALHAEDEAVLKSGDAQHYKLERREVAEGQVGWDLVTRLLLRDRDGEIVGLIVVFRDVTALKNAEGKVQEAVERRDQFLAMLSHELRNPLGAIVTATAMLKTLGSNSPPPRLLDVLDRQSHQMATLLDELLEVSRVTQSKIHLEKRPVDLRASIEHAAAVVRPQMEARRLSFAVDLPDVPVVVDADPARLQQIFVNLLSNAAKYTTNGGHVRLSATVEAGSAVVAVRDDGVGIAAAMLESVFDLFVQARGTLDRSAGGLGVGLTLVRSLVQMHGGSVDARSDGEGHGSEFVVRLPLTAAPVWTEQGSTSVPPRPIPRGANILVVEDNVDSRELLGELLSQAGFNCRTAAQGTTALAMMDEQTPDIAIFDVGLPEMDGLTLARRVRSEPRFAAMRLIALTGYGQAVDRAAARAAGFDHHIVKPVQPDDLLALLAGGAPAAAS